MMKKFNYESERHPAYSEWQKTHLSDPDTLHKNDKYDPDGFWDGETIDDNNYHPTYRPKK